MSDIKKKDRDNQTPKADRGRLSFFMQESSNIFAENRLLRFVLGSMVVWSAFNSVMLSYALSDRVTIITPPDESYQFEVTSNSANDTYLYRMARHIVFLAGNLTAATGRDQLNDLLRYIHPSKTAQYQEHFNTLAKEIERYPNITSLVELNGTSSMKVKGDVVTIDVTKKRLIGDTVVKKDRVRYKLTYTIEEGRFWVMDLKEVNREQSVEVSE
ncbi:TraE/TraK family type IV conjugative transfer system protein [Pseudoalteromonas luteoviolacea]|uniref:TraE/TraK family type IV conjugative transfer system protein n=1 Tax=Pseudoalteromonas luteoviolacea TaxID=43657 RepID=UPI001B3886F1|nr:TraE/TraK family type IV conjugative transfer system protein [Pseudoalteromonas luteoviolacea]MBQ4839837.1 hypothetical protein [Pseudoalteromonas luteoviolacea]